MPISDFQKRKLLRDFPAAEFWIPVFELIESRVGPAGQLSARDQFLIMTALKAVSEVIFGSEERDPVEF